MEQFYQLLKDYNIRFATEVSNLPEWFFQYTEYEPPLYWKTVYEILKYEDRNQSIVEIGAGFGDITALLYFMGFHKIISFEYDIQLVKYTNCKIKNLFNKKANTIDKKYPQKLNFTPDILIQVNCIYEDNIYSKPDYLKQVKSFYQINGIPKIFIFESIDDDYKVPNGTFPECLRLNERNITEVFTKCQIESYKTYKYPINKVSKTLYKICK